MKAEQVERGLWVVASLAIIVDNLVLTHRSVPAVVCAVIGAAAVLAAIAIGSRRWWLERKNPKQPSGPNYDRTPYV